MWEYVSFNPELTHPGDERPITRTHNYRRILVIVEIRQ
jgi:hypothetical protein